MEQCRDRVYLLNKGVKAITVLSYYNKEKAIIFLFYYS